MGSFENNLWFFSYPGRSRKVSDSVCQFIGGTTKDLYKKSYFYKKLPIWVGH